MRHEPPPPEEGERPLASVDNARAIVYGALAVVILAIAGAIFSLLQ
jgi:hypothetical protein